jgi:hypothetical protein
MLLHNGCHAVRAIDGVVRRGAHHHCVGGKVFGRPQIARQHVLGVSAKARNAQRLARFGRLVVFGVCRGGDPHVPRTGVEVGSRLQTVDNVLQHGSTREPLQGLPRQSRRPHPGLHHHTHGNIHGRVSCYLMFFASFGTM